jgi:WhiB family redox-sensing transcriptional regulator
MPTSPHWSRDIGQQRAEPDFVDGRQACAGDGLDPELWFPDFPGNGAKKAQAKAIQICWTCPLRRPCLQFAIESEQRFGVWGGTTPAQRAAALGRS